jgi:hydroxymethylpyrimidine/phosphomethylpyrimidine kinase
MDALSRTSVCTVAGSDPTGGAGLQADLKTFAAHGVRGTAVVTAVTVQGRRGVRRVEPVAADVVGEQLDVVLEEVRPAAIKTGMLWDAGVVRAVADRLAAAPDVPLVVDPVLGATAGGDLVRPDALPALRDRLIPLAQVVTPNLPEAARLLGVREVREADMEAAARALLDLGCGAVVLKGGHGEGDDAVDWLVRRDAAPLRTALPRVRGVFAHGTGCAFSASLAASLATGRDLASAFVRAKDYVHRALRAAAARGPDAPLEHDA